jgi:hypothetical protein
MALKESENFKYCGRVFTREEIELIRGLIAAEPRRNRAQLSRVACDELRWFSPNGRRKDMSCRVAMLRMERDGLITLPPPQKGNGNGHNRPRLTSASAPRAPISLSGGQVAKLVFQCVDSRRDSLLWNELIQRHHYLRYKPLPGAQLRYLVFSGSHLLAALGFGASAWKVAPRDQWIGWSEEERRHNLHLVVNNARYLILPWIRSPNLASRILSGVARQLPGDWESRYHYSPVLLETFVERERFQGTCYRAANWIHVGHTQGRGKLDRKYQRLLPVKEIFLYPLRRDFRRRLCSLSCSEQGGG